MLLSLFDNFGKSNVLSLAEIASGLTSKGISYDDVKLNYTLVVPRSHDDILGMVAGPSRPCIMHTVFCDIRLRLYSPVSSLLLATNSRGVPHRSARLSG